MTRFTALVLLLLAAIPVTETRAASPDPPAPLPLEAAGPIDNSEYSIAFKACVTAAELPEQFEVCVRSELDRQSRRLDTAFQESLTAARRVGGSDLVEGRQATWISESSARCQAPPRQIGPVNRTHAIDCLIWASILRRLEIQGEMNR
jgi:uncharacterized protein YecT (DUF1311 family)